MCFAPQTACTFSTSQLPKVVRSWCVLYILTWKCALRHNGVQFFISHMASWLRTSRFSKPTFRPSGATNHMRDEKVHAVVARSTFPSQNVQNTSASDNFWTLRCRKSARRCGEKHIWKSKCQKHLNVGALLEVEMMKKCTPLWREAHVEVKSGANIWCFEHFDLEMCFAPLLEVRMLKKWSEPGVFCTS